MRSFSCTLHVHERLRYKLYANTIIGSSDNCKEWSCMSIGQEVNPVFGPFMRLLKLLAIARGGFFFNNINNNHA